MKKEMCIEILKELNLLKTCLKETFNKLTGFQKKNFEDNLKYLENFSFKNIFF